MQLYDIDFSVNKVIVVKKGNLQNYNYFICENPFNGVPLAYIELTNKHKLYKKSPEDIDKYITCHGGITYTGKRSFAKYCIGWDYGHLGDFMPFLTFGQKWTVEEIEAECKDVIYQLIKM